MLKKARLVKALFAKCFVYWCDLRKAMKAVIPLTKLGSRLKKKKLHRPVTRVTVKKKSGIKIIIIKDIL
ncbi:hypothetical protein [Bacillus cereus]|uniref:hypothetical protein n=1 Tax=Bacillus cereus TaxID=1396 RepID=UPI001C5561DF|nr:hypothetical protein [Bacillus cereus]